MTNEEKARRKKLSAQCQRLLFYLDRYGKINPMQAINYLGIMRLAARINDLEYAGYRFDHRMMTGENRFKEKIRYMEYSIKVA